MVAEKPTVFYEVDASWNENKPWTVGFDTFQDDLIPPHGFIVRMKVRKVRAGHEQNLFSLGYFGNGLADSLAGAVALVSDYDGHEFELPEGFLQEGKLNFQRMFLAMSLSDKLDEVTFCFELLAKLLFHGYKAQGGCISPSVIHRSSLEVGPVAGGHNDHRFKLHPFHKLESVRGNLP
jgi:hypothetical protein